MNSNDDDKARNEDESSTVRRSLTLLRHLEAQGTGDSEPSNRISLSCVVSNPNQITVRIGDVSLTRTKPLGHLAQTVPSLYLAKPYSNEDQETLRIMRFLMQKDSLGQDVYLIGPPGPLRRRVALKYAELTKRTVEYVALSADTTESELKQRREIFNGTALYVDCAATSAAINGSLLILEGVEKAERNVLVVLNNLLENREMALEDGRFLVSPKRFDALLKVHSQEELNSWKLVRTSDQFRVVALGLPIPRYLGNPLDPPFRSRFQAKDVQGPSLGQLLTPHTPFVLKCLLQSAAVIREMRETEGTQVSAQNAVPEFPQNFEFFLQLLLELVPEFPSSFLVRLVFPFLDLLQGVPDDRLHVVRKIFRRFGVEDANRELGFNDGLGSMDDTVSQTLAQQKFCSQIVFQGVDLKRLVATFSLTLESPMGESASNLETKVLKLPCTIRGSRQTQFPLHFVETPANSECLSRMMLLHLTGQDFCLIGEKGEGKSRLVSRFAQLLNYDMEHIPMYKDFSARQLLQRRATNANNDTIWEDSPLVQAALFGRLAVLDGIEQMAPGTLGTLQNLVLDRECILPDGKRRLISQKRFAHICQRDGLSQEELISRGFHPIHEAFRIVCLARPSNLTSGSSSASQARGAWLSPELVSMFRFVYLHHENAALLLLQNDKVVNALHLDQLNTFANSLRLAIAKDDTLACLETCISIRQTVRVCAQIAGTPAGSGALRKSLEAAALDRFLPPMTRQVFHSLLDAAGIVKSLSEKTEASSSSSWKIEMLPPTTPNAIGLLKVGSAMTVDVFPARDPLLVPSIVFYDNPRQTKLLGEMIRDWKAGQHLLLIGNQGVGKNKLADRMLQWMQLPREYIQLHRDTTVQNLTSNPTIVDGKLIYEDSPLVKAVREGRVLVVDEADKAPTYVTAILKSLIEDKQMLLGDGKRIVSSDYPEMTSEEVKMCIRMHPEFRVIALANRPGFPFHGNDFFREVGDVFACHAIDNPDAESELVMMKEYGPSVPLETLRKLVNAFDELRNLSDEGKLTYPYSTRELAAVVKHMQAFPNEGIASILRNVFDFDTTLQEEKQILIEVFAKHGIPFSLDNHHTVASATSQVKTGDMSKSLLPPRLMERWQVLSHQKVPQLISSPLNQVARFNHGTKSLFWNFKPEPVLVGRVSNKQDQSGSYFSEERYNFRLPHLSLVLGAALLENGVLAIVGRTTLPSVSFGLFLVDQFHASFELHDLFGALPSEGSYRVTPKLASLVVLQQGKVLAVGHPESRYILILHIQERRMYYLDTLPGVDKTKRIKLVGGNNETLLMWYQPGGNQIGVLDLISEVHVSMQVPMLLVQSAFMVSDKEWVLSGENQQDTVLLRFNEDFSFSFDVMDKRDAVLGKLNQPAVRFCMASSDSLSNPPGGNAKQVVKPLLFSNGAVGFATEFPPSSSLVRSNIYCCTVDSPQQQQPHIRLTKGLFLRQAQVCVASKEHTDLYQVDVEISDLESLKVRSFVVPLQEDLVAPSSLPKLTFSKPLTALSPASLQGFNMVRQAIGDCEQRLFLVEHADGESLITVDCLGTIRVFYATELALRRAFQDWRKLMGKGQESEDKNQLTPISNRVDDGEEGNGNGNGEGEGNGSGNGEGNGNGEGEGNGDGKGEGQGTGEGVGGGSGGSSVSSGGGSNTGKGKGKRKFEELNELPDPGQFRAERQAEEAILAAATASSSSLSSSLREEDAEVKRTAQLLKKQEFDEILKRIGMTEFDAQKYAKYHAAVSGEIRELRSILESLESKDQERVWHGNQLVGDLDEHKLIDSLTGEKNVYKRRMEVDPNNPFFLSKPKRLSFVFDVSMSMSRYASDGRLERSLEACVMIMESLKGFERKFDYRVTGHSGDTDELKLVEWAKPPANDKERLNVIKAMHAHTETCDSGDHTLEAAKKAILNCAAQVDADDRFVFLISDANLDQYSITPEMIGKLFELDQRVHVFVLFIANGRDSAASFAKKMPGNVFVCLDKAQLPKVLKRMFLAAASSKS